ncbi:MAG: DUF3256 family protein [Muribaculaceae bacterium]
MKKALFLFFSVICTMATFAQTAAESAFYSAPADIIPYAQRMMRQDFVDYYKSGSEKIIRNKLYDGSRILSLSDNSILIQETADSLSTAQIAVEASKGDSIIIFIRNIATPAIDGAISFYSVDWTKMNKKAFREPSLKDWVKGGKAELNAAKQLVPFVMAKYVYDADSKILTLSASFADFMPQDDFNKVSSLLFSTIRYAWDGNKMKLLDKQ